MGSYFCGTIILMPENKLCNPYYYYLTIPLFNNLSLVGVTVDLFSSNVPGSW